MTLDALFDRGLNAMQQRINVPEVVHRLFRRCWLKGPGSVIPDSIPVTAY